LQWTVTQNHGTIEGYFRGFSVVQLSAAYARCHGTNCDIKGSCLRFLVLKYWDPQETPATKVINPDPKGCALFLVVRKDEMVSTTGTQSPQPASAKDRQAVSAIPVVGGAAAK
jgi:hypothetical protein